MPQRTSRARPAPDPTEIQLAIWREACLHLDLDQALARIEPILERALRVRAIVVRRFDRARARLEIAAASGDPPTLPSVIDLAPDALAEVLGLFANRGFRAGRSAKNAAIGARLVAASDRNADVLVAGLTDDDGPTAIVMLVSRARFEPSDATLANELIEPLGVALANDRRLHELARLREAAEAENRALLSRLDRSALVEQVLGEHGGLKHVMERVAQVSVTSVPVLLLGETGSGKEVIARAIHDRSPRRAGPLVRVNCGAIPPELVDSELFGHERGSFTGAIAMRKGWFERADGGTLLLDEIGELPLAAQVRLLRVLQEGTLERVGSGRALHVDVRIVAATHRDLHQMVDAGTFREDLWYRISVFPLRLPPLRERPEDIPELARYFATKSASRLGAAPLVPTADDIRLLLAYAWPGNVRELGAVIERAAILGHAKKLDVASALGAGARTRASTPPAPMSTGASTDTLDDVIRAHIERVLSQTGGRIEGPRGAAASLGVNPHTLRARMRKLRIDWSRFRGNSA